VTDARGITFEARGWIEKPCREEDTVVELRRQLQPGERWGAWERVSLAPSLELVNHSPAGFAWGYAGSGSSSRSSPDSFGPTRGKSTSTSHGGLSRRRASPPTESRATARPS